MNAFDRIVKWISVTFAVCASSIIAIIMVLTAADVAKRSLTGSSIPGVIEFSEVFLVAAVFLGLAFALRIGAHVGVDIVIARMNKRASQRVQMIGMTIAVIVLIWMTIQTAGAAVHSISINEFRYGLIKVPIWPARLIVPIGLAALILECLVFLCRLAPGLRSSGQATSEGADRDHESHAEEGKSWN